MRTSAAARRYARALFGLAKEDGATARVRAELDTLAELFAASPEMQEALLTPLYPAGERRRALRSLAEREGLSHVVDNFCSYLIDQRRLVDFPGIREEFVRLVDADSGLVIADVIAASPLDEARRDRLRRALSDRTGRDVRLEVTVDPTLIGGAIARVGDIVFDGSIRRQLEHLRANLTKESQA
jgi:F-type H+-transporting ATPase subunit delta